MLNIINYVVIMSLPVLVLFTIRIETIDSNNETYRQILYDKKY